MPYDGDLIKLLAGHDIEHLKMQNQSSDTSATSAGLRADEWELSEKFKIEPPTLLMTVRRSSGATEERVRKTLGISSMLLANVSASLWGRTFSQERDRRAGEGANAQKRGQVTRQMQAELKNAMEAAQHGNGQ